MGEKVRNLDKMETWTWEVRAGKLEILNVQMSLEKFILPIYTPPPLSIRRLYNRLKHYIESLGFRTSKMTNNKPQTHLGTPGFQGMS